MNMQRPELLSSALPSVRELLTSAFRERRKIAYASGGLFCLAVVPAFVIPINYEATASLLVLPGVEYAPQPEAGGTSSVINATLAREEFLRSEVEILSTQALHEAVVRRVGLATLYPTYLEPPGLLKQAQTVFTGWAAAVAQFFGAESRPERTIDPARDAVKEFDAHLDTTPLKEGAIIELSFRHEDPDVAAQTLNTLLNMYIEQRHEIYADVQSNALAAQVRTARDELDALDQKREEFEATNGVFNYDQQRQILLQSQADLTRDLNEADSQEAQLASRLVALKEQLAKTPVNVVQYADTDNEERASDLRTALAQIQAKLADQRVHYEPNSRTILETTAERNHLQADLDAVLKDKTPSSTRTGRNATYDVLDAERVRAEADHAAAAARRQADKSHLIDIAQQLNRTNSLELALNRLERQRAISDQNYRDVAKLLDERRSVEQIREQKAENVRVIQAATPPIHPRKTREIIILAGLFLSAITAAALAFVLEITRTRYISSEQVERTLGLPVLASVPHLADEPA